LCSLPGTSRDQAAVTTGTGRAGTRRRAHRHRGTPVLRRGSIAGRRRQATRRQSIDGQPSACGGTPDGRRADRGHRAAPVEGFEDELAQQLGLERVYVAPGAAASDDPGAVLAGAVGQALLDSKLSAGDALLVSWGRATWSLSHAELPRIPGVVVVPALGGLNDEQPWVQTNEIARRIAARLQGSVLLLHAPAVPSAELRDSLLTDESIRAALTRWDDAAAALVGIGAWSRAQPEPPSILSMDAKTLRSSAGDVAGRLFDAEGAPIPYAAEPRLLGISREQLARVRRRIGVGCRDAKGRGDRRCCSVEPRERARDRHHHRERAECRLR